MGERTIGKIIYKRGMDFIEERRETREARRREKEENNVEFLRKVSSVMVNFQILLNNIKDTLKKKEEEIDYEDLDELKKKIHKYNQNLSSINNLKRGFSLGEKLPDNEINSSLNSGNELVSKKAQIVFLTKSIKKSLLEIDSLILKDKGKLEGRRAEEKEKNRRDCLEMLRELKYVLKKFEENLGLNLNV